MISTILATMTMVQSPTLSFTMILVAGNEHPITDAKMIDEPSKYSMTIEVQKLATEMDRRKSAWMLIDGGSIGDRLILTENPIVFAMGRMFRSFFSSTEVTTKNGKTTKTEEEAGQGISTFSGSHGVPRQDRIRGGTFVNSMMGAKDSYLFMTDLSTLLLANRDKRNDDLDHFKNSLAFSRESIRETEDWLKTYQGTIRPTMILCASGRPQDGHRDLLAFPPTGVILTYQVTFDQRWSAELKDIIRVK